MKIAVDAMGGDFAPRSIVEGALQASQRLKHDIILVGDPARIRVELRRLDAENAPIRIEACTDVVEMDESPAQGCRQKPNSSIMVAARLVAQGHADAMVSAGNSGASMTAALWHMRRLPGVSRPSIVTFLPTLTGFCILTDAGANVDCKPKHLLQFAVMGTELMKNVFNRPSPKVGILSIGEEEGKGNELTVASAALLKKYLPNNFIGNVEGRDIPRGMADVVVCDGFVGNIVLKFAEGLGEALVTLIKDQIDAHPIAKLGGLFLKGSLGEVKKKTDYAEYGGAPLMGVNGVSIICHGKSNPKAIYNAIRVAGDFAQKGANAAIRRELQRIHSETEAAPTVAQPATA